MKAKPKPKAKPKAKAKAKAKPRAKRKRRPSSAIPSAHWSDKHTTTRVRRDGSEMVVTVRRPATEAEIKRHAYDFRWNNE